MKRPRTMDRLKKSLAKVASKADVDEDLIISLLARCRETLEVIGNPSEFRYLRLFCDLILHARIDRPNNFFVLREFSDAFGDKERNALDLSTDILRLRSLVNQIGELMQRFSVPTDLLRQPYLPIFLARFLDEISQKRIECTNTIQDELGNFLPEKIRKIFGNRSTRVDSIAFHRLEGASGLAAYVLQFSLLLFPKDVQDFRRVHVVTRFAIGLCPNCGDYDYSHPNESTAICNSCRTPHDIAQLPRKEQPA